MEEAISNLPRWINFALTLFHTCADVATQKNLQSTLSHTSPILQRKRFFWVKTIMSANLKTPKP